MPELLFGLAIILWLVAEGWAIHDERAGNTWSAWTWRGRALAWARVPMVGLAAWGAWHLFFEPPAVEPFVEDDLYIAASAGVATLVRRDWRLGR